MYSLSGIRRGEIAREILKRAKVNAVQPTVVRVESMEALAPQAVAAAEDISVAERRIGEENSLEWLKRVECVDGRDDGLFVCIYLGLRGAGKESEIGMVVETRRTTILGVGLQMVEKHPVASIADRLLAILAPPWIYAHAGEGVPTPE